MFIMFVDGFRQDEDIVEVQKLDLQLSCSQYNVHQSLKRIQYVLQTKWYLQKPTDPWWYENVC